MIRLFSSKEISSWCTSADVVSILYFKGFPIDITMKWNESRSFLILFIPYKSELEYSALWIESSKTNEIDEVNIGQMFSIMDDVN